jgi:hypothetical protein
MSQQYVEVDIGGKVRLMRFDYNAVSDVEEKMGKGIPSIFSEQNVGFNTIRMFYWAGLKWKNPGLTPQLAGNWLQDELANGRDMVSLMEPIMIGLKQAKILKTAEPGEEEKN